MKPPFRADQVGSLLRPPELREARAGAKRGDIPPAELRQAEEIADLAAAGCKYLQLDDTSFAYLCDGLSGSPCDAQWRKLERIVEVAREVWR